MTWFQLVEHQNPEPYPSQRLVPNSAFFLNPAITAKPQHEPVPVQPQLRLLHLVH